MVEYLVGNGGDIYSRSIGNVTCLHLVAGSGEPKLCKLFVDIYCSFEYEIDVQLENGLINFSGNVFSENIRTVINRRAVLICIDENYDTPLHYAALKGRASVCKWLIENGVDVTLRNKKNQTARDFALAEGHKEANLAMKKWYDIAGR